MLGFRLQRVGYRNMHEPVFSNEKTSGARPLTCIFLEGRLDCRVTRTVRTLHAACHHTEVLVMCQGHSRSERTLHQEETQDGLFKHGPVTGRAAVCK
mmetsp:Transcript_23250/g.34915  ORF Transcript_23250/g.34915 Transcript_23250/m.34915 type:complete len:97 (+) Transcript_23250:987-1277(+)